MAKPIKDMTGMRFERLTVMSLDRRQQSGNKIKAY